MKSFFLSGLNSLSRQRKVKRRLIYRWEENEEDLISVDTYDYNKTLAKLNCAYNRNFIAVIVDQFSVRVEKISLCK